MSNPTKKNNSKRRLTATTENDENQPRKKKTRRKVKSNDGIAMSKQLANKVKQRKTTRQSSRKKDNELRLCGNGKPMPSLSELEKMFDDSDTDEDSPNTPVDKVVPRICTTPEPKHSPLIINEDKLTSPTTLKQIVSKVIKRIEELPTIDLIDDEPPPPVIPPKKRKKPEVPYIVGCREREQVPWKPKTNFLVGDTKYGVEESSENEECCSPKAKRRRSKKINLSKSVFNAKSDEIAARLTVSERTDHNDSSNSSDTVDYEFTNKLPQKTTRPFSPLPSTSKDNETFLKNDQRFNDSLLINNVSSDDLQNNEDNVLEIPKDNKDQVLENNFDGTTVESDIINNVKQELQIDVELCETSNSEDVKVHLKNEKIDVSLENDDFDVQIIETPNDVVIIDDSLPSINLHTPISTHNINDDDCCIVVSTDNENQIPNKSEPLESYSFKDDIYGSIDLTNIEADTESCEVIDVDDIIAESQAVINKIQNKHSTLNCVTLVEPNTSHKSEIVDNVEQNQSVQIITNDDQVLPQSNQESSDIIEITTESSNIPASSESLLSRDSVAQMSSSPQIQPNEEETFLNRSCRFLADMLRSDALDMLLSVPNIVRSRNNSRNRSRNNNRRHNITSNMNSESNRLYANLPISVQRFENNNPPVTNSRNLESNTSLSETRSQPSTISTETTSQPSTNSRQLGDCPICMDSLSNGAVASTLCGHLFCMNCIKAAIKASGKKCPTCRKNLKGPTPYHQIFL